MAAELTRYQKHEISSHTFEASDRIFAELVEADIKEEGMNKRNSNWSKLGNSRTSSDLIGQFKFLDGFQHIRYSELVRSISSFKVKEGDGIILISDLVNLNSRGKKYIVEGKVKDESENSWEIIDGDGHKFTVRSDQLLSVDAYTNLYILVDDAAFSYEEMEIDRRSESVIKAIEFRRSRVKRIVNSILGIFGKSITSKYEQTILSAIDQPSQEYYENVLAELIKGKANDSLKPGEYSRNMHVFGYKNSLQGLRESEELKGVTLQYEVQNLKAFKGFEKKMIILPEITVEELKVETELILKDHRRKLARYLLIKASKGKKE
jgi:hypothetical protein